MTNQTPEAGRGDEQSSETTGGQSSVEETRDIAESMVEATWNGGKDTPSGPGIPESYQLWVAYGKRVARAYLELLDTQTSHRTRPQDPEVGANQDSELEVEQ